MSFDPIVDEVQRIRQEQAARFGYDIEKIYEELKRLERQDPAPILHAPEAPPPDAKVQRARLGRS
jgi:hypothetical protein